MAIGTFPLFKDRASLPFEGEVELVTVYDNAFDWPLNSAGRLDLDVAIKIGEEMGRRPHQWRSFMPPLREGKHPTRFAFLIPSISVVRRIEARAQTLAPDSYNQYTKIIAFEECLQRVVGFSPDPKDKDKAIDCRVEIPREVRQELTTEIETRFGEIILNMARGRIAKEGELDEKKSPLQSSSTPEES